ncbi:THO complex subunit 4D-like [Euphorbia lathyris]|uniref:THO complex subunit 4D-like n=1 Tax=Euphorbia lathyris TaxID=212925 RepID=UPI003313ECD0
MAISPLDMCLDDIIKNSRGRGRGRGSFDGGRMSGVVPPPRRDSIRAAAVGGITTGTKIYVSNLDYGVSSEDIRELFSVVGDLKRCVVHYDEIGRSNGSGEVVYTRKSDAFAAIKKYNNVILDGKPMKLEIVGGTEEVGVNGRMKKASTQGHGGGPSRPGGMRNGGGGREGGRGRGGHGRGKKEAVEKTAEELDKELEVLCLCSC